MATPVPVELEAVTQGRPQARLQIFRESLSRVTGLSQRLPDLPPLFPFKLGEGARDWALPYAFDDRIVALGSYAVEELFDHIAQRRQTGEVAIPQRYGLRRGIQPWAIRLAASASEIDPLLDPALVEAWCDGSAGTLGEELTGAFSRALESELLSDDAPPYATLVAVAAPALVEALKGRVKSRSLRGVSYERLEKALGFALFALIELSAQRAIRELERRPRPRDTRGSVERVRLCLNPLLYCSIRSRALQNPLNPWWLSDDLNEIWVARRAEELLTRPIDQLLQAALDQLLGSSESRVRHARAGRVSRVRQTLLRLLWDYDRGPEEPWGALRAALNQDEVLDQLRTGSKALFHQLHQAGVSAKATAPLQSLLGSGGSDLEDLQAALVAQITFGIDRLLADHLERMAKGLRDTRADGDARELIQLYERGQLYRLSSDQKPILQVAQRKTCGHLFVDLKGFTQRTVRAKEIVVADFLKREFYEPILQAAGALNVLGGEEVKLLNLVGDAAAFAGEVPSLVRLASEIRRLCNSYQKTLAGIDPGAAATDEERMRREIQTRLNALEEPLLLEASMLEAEIARKQALTPEAREEELSRQLQARAGELAKAHLEIRQGLAAAQPEARRQLEIDMLRVSEAQETLAATARATLERLAPIAPEPRAAAILELITSRERARLEDLGQSVKHTREQASREVAQRRRLARTAQGGGLEAGVFISYGTAPEEIRIQDQVFGEVRVSVAEKLNEAARGTGRSSKVAEEVAEALRVAGARAGNPQLRDPFSVHVGNGVGGEGATEIFNVGEAMSAEALDMFLQQTAGSRLHFERTARRAELAPEIVDQLAVPDRLSVIVSLEAEGLMSNALVFRRVGLVQFRGFEEGESCEVYELLSPDHRFTKLLAQHHLPRWSDEARANPKLLLTGLPGRQR